MIFDRTIDVEVRHSLGIEGVKERLRKMAEDQRGKNPHITCMFTKGGIWEAEREIGNMLREALK